MISQFWGLGVRGFVLLVEGGGRFYRVSGILLKVWATRSQCGQISLHNIGALIITYTILAVPYYNYSIMGPKTLF